MYTPVLVFACPTGYACVAWDQRKECWPGGKTKTVNGSHCLASFLVLEESILLRTGHPVWLPTGNIVECILAMGKSPKLTVVMLILIGRPFLFFQASIVWLWHHVSNAAGRSVKAPAWAADAWYLGSKPVPL